MALTRVWEQNYDCCFTAKKERLLDQWFDKSLRSDIAGNDDSLPAKAAPLIDAADGKWTREVLKETILWFLITDMSAQDRILF